MCKPFWGRGLSDVTLGLWFSSFSNSCKVATAEDMLGKAEQGKAEVRTAERPTAGGARAPADLPSTCHSPETPPRACYPSPAPSLPTREDGGKSEPLPSQCSEFLRSIVLLFLVRGLQLSKNNLQPSSNECRFSWLEPGGWTRHLFKSGDREALTSMQVGTSWLEPRN